jgi:uncharacterized membrane protein YgdD (TMEM256/DUF423 family)
MKKSWILKVAAVLGASGVGIGAFGAHAMKAYLVEIGRADTFETAVRYHLVHSVVLLVLGIWDNLSQTSNSWISRAGVAFSVGILIFSGSLYVLCLTNTPWWGAVTPLGGVAFMAGWLMIWPSAKKGLS